MTLVIDATPGSATANSFATEAEAIAYAAARLNLSGWTTVSGTTCTESEKAALIEATRDISTREFIGMRATTTQILSWPRWWAINPDAPTFAYVYFQSTEIPQRVKDATMELAVQYLEAGTTDIAGLDSYNNVARQNIGGAIDTQYIEPWQRARGLGRWPRVLDRLRPLLIATPAGTRLVRG